YKEYHQLPLYIITFTGALEGRPQNPGWSRLRKDPGFNLLSEDMETKARTGETYNISVLVQKGRIRYYINGRLIHDYTDPEPYTSGWFAWRTWHTNLCIREVKAWEL